MTETVPTTQESAELELYFIGAVGDIHGHSDVVIRLGNAIFLLTGALARFDGMWVEVIVRELKTTRQLTASRLEETDEQP